MRCKACHYSLQELTEPRCPECGRAFDPDDEETYEVQPSFFTPWMVVATIFSFGALWYAVRTWSYRPDPADPNNGEGVMAVMAGCCAIFLLGPFVFLAICMIRSIQLRR